jgi:hypothetical protein
MAAEKPSEKAIQNMATLFGSYLGETYRRNHGGEWGVSEDTPALSFGQRFCSYPWARVYKRLSNGEEDNVHHWYLGMIQYGINGGQPQVSSPTNPPPLPLPPQKKGLFSKLFGG